MNNQVTELVAELDALDIGFAPGADGVLSFSRTQGKSLAESFREQLTVQKHELISVALARAKDNAIALSLTMADLQSAYIEPCVIWVRRKNGERLKRTPEQLAATADRKIATLAVVLRDLDLDLVRVVGRRS